MFTNKNHENENLSFHWGRLSMLLNADLVLPGRLTRLAVDIVDLALPGRIELAFDLALDGLDLLPCVYPSVEFKLLVLLMYVEFRPSSAAMCS
jgi:hypothetical protein